MTLRLLPAALSLALCVTVFLAGAGRAETLREGQEIHLDLDMQSQMRVHIPAPRDVAVDILYAGRRQIGTVIGNGHVEIEEVVWARLCADCAPVVFVPVWDASSTYGAVTGIILWPQGGTWGLSVLDLMRPYLSDPDSNGLSVLRDRFPADGRLMEQDYHFRDGALSPASEPRPSNRL